MREETDDAMNNIEIVCAVMFFVVIMAVGVEVKRDSDISVCAYQKCAAKATSFNLSERICDGNWPEFQPEAIKQFVPVCEAEMKARLGGNRT
jgi:hypothetical protein